MKSKLLAFVAGLALSVSAWAGPAVSLPSSGQFLKFTGMEQIALGGASTGNGVIGAADEINWGVFVVSTINKANVTIPHDQLSPTGFPWFADGLTHGAQITGMFYDVKAAVGPATSAFPASGGILDLYWRDLSIYSATDVATLSAAGPAGLRTSTSTATGFTEGTLLARILFTPGIDGANATVTIAGDVTPSGLGVGVTGLADSYGAIDMGTPGLWSSQLNTDWFNTALAGVTADLRFKNSYNRLNTWDNLAAGIIGAKLDDPAQAFVLPLPSTLPLLGIALLGLALVRRRQA